MIVEIVFFVTFMGLAMAIRSYREWLRNTQTISSHAASEHPEKGDEEHYRDIESSLINMFVFEHDDKICPYHHQEIVQGSINHGIKFSVKSFSVQDKLGEEIEINLPEQLDQEKVEGEGEEEGNIPIVCSICLDPFRVHDIVSISPKKWSCGCHHIFHHICIKEWLLNHKTCPSCRQDFFDNNKTAAIICADKSADDEDDNGINHSNDPKYSHPPHLPDRLLYCIQHGIMVVGTTTLEQYPTTDHIIIPNSPKKEDLMLLRLHPTKLIHDEQCHDESTESTMGISISFEEEEEESEAACQETNSLDGSVTRMIFVCSDSV